MNGAAEAPLHEFRYEPAVVDVSMSQQHRIDAGRRKWEFPVVERTFGLGTLEHAAVNHQAMGAGVKDVA